jgi:hypothetical protein
VQQEPQVQQAPPGFKELLALLVPQEFLGPMEFLVQQVQQVQQALQGQRANRVMRDKQAPPELPVVKDLQEFLRLQQQ